MRTALLARWSASDFRRIEWAHVTDDQMRVTRLLSGEAVAFFGRDLPVDLVTELDLRDDGYYTVDERDRVRTRVEYP